MVPSNFNLWLLAFWLSFYVTSSVLDDVNYSRIKNLSDILGPKYKLNHLEKLLKNRKDTVTSYAIVYETITLPVTNVIMTSYSRTMETLIISETKVVTMTTTLTKLLSPEPSKPLLPEVKKDDSVEMKVETRTKTSTITSTQMTTLVEFLPLAFETVYKTKTKFITNTELSANKKLVAPFLLQTTCKLRNIVVTTPPSNIHSTPFKVIKATNSLMPTLVAITPPYRFTSKYLVEDTMLIVITATFTTTYLETNFAYKTEL